MKNGIEHMRRGFSMLINCDKRQITFRNVRANTHITLCFPRKIDSKYDPCVKVPGVSKMRCVAMESVEALGKLFNDFSFGI